MRFSKIIYLTITFNVFLSHNLYGISFDYSKYINKKNRNTIAVVSSAAALIAALIILLYPKNKPLDPPGSNNDQDESPEQKAERMRIEIQAGQERLESINEQIEEKRATLKELDQTLQPKNVDSQIGKRQAELDKLLQQEEAEIASLAELEGAKLQVEKDLEGLLERLEKIIPELEQKEEKLQKLSEQEQKNREKLNAVIAHTKRAEQSRAESIQKLNDKLAEIRSQVEKRERELQRLSKLEKRKRTALTIVTINLEQKEEELKELSQKITQKITPEEEDALANIDLESAKKTPFHKCSESLFQLDEEIRASTPDDEQGGEGFSVNELVEKFGDANESEETLPDESDPEGYSSEDADVSSGLLTPEDSPGQTLHRRMSSMRLGLHAACKRGKTKEIPAVKDMLEENMDRLEELDDQGKTPLHNACIGGKIELVRWLVEKLEKHGKDIEKEDLKGNTALHYARDKGIFSYLCNEKKFNTRARNRKGETPFQTVSKKLSREYT